MQSNRPFTCLSVVLLLVRLHVTLSTRLGLGARKHFLGAGKLGQLASPSRELAKMGMGQPSRLAVLSSADVRYRLPQAPPSGQSEP